MDNMVSSLGGDDLDGDGDGDGVEGAGDGVDGDGDGEGVDGAGDQPLVRKPEIELALTT